MAKHDQSRMNHCDSESHEVVIREGVTQGKVAVLSPEEGVDARQVGKNLGDPCVSYVHGGA